jgi:hypothetical protein
MVWLQRKPLLSIRTRRGGPSFHLDGQVHVTARWISLRALAKDRQPAIIGEL